MAEGFANRSDKEIGYGLHSWAGLLQRLACMALEQSLQPNATFGGSGDRRSPQNPSPSNTSKKNFLGISGVTFARTIWTFEFAAFTQAF